jgi:hypothetical protein
MEDHFSTLLQLGEVCAARTIATLIDEKCSKDNHGYDEDEDVIIYLLVTIAIDPLELGYCIKTLPNGNFNALDENGKLPIQKQMKHSKHTIKYGRQELHG